MSTLCAVLGINRMGAAAKSTDSPQEMTYLTKTQTGTPERGRRDMNKQAELHGKAVPDALSSADGVTIFLFIVESSLTVLSLMVWILVTSQAGLAMLGAAPIPLVAGPSLVVAAIRVAQGRPIPAFVIVVFTGIGVLVFTGNAGSGGQFDRGRADGYGARFGA